MKATKAKPRPVDPNAPLPIRGLRSDPDAPRQPMRVGAGCYPTIIGPGTDKLYKRIPGTEQYPDHTTIEDEVSANPLSFRELLFFTIPAHVIEPHGRAYGDISIRQDSAANIGVKISLSFFCHALQLARNHGNMIDTWVEVILRSPGEQPICTGVHKSTSFKDVPFFPRAKIRKTFERKNIAGWRIVAMLKTRSVGPETIMRQALSDIQHCVGAITEEALEYKRMFLPISDSLERDNAINKYVFSKAEETVRARQRKRGGAVGGAIKKKRAPGSTFDEYLDEEVSDTTTASGSGTSQEAFEADLRVERDKLLKAIHAVVRDDRPTVASRVYDSLNVSHYAVATLTAYVEKVLAPVRILNDVMDAERIGRVCALIHGDWKEALYMPDCDATYLAARNVFSFDSSCATLMNVRGADADSRKDEEYPCSIQLDPASYGLDESGTLSFPMPYCVWSVLPSSLTPEYFLNSLFAWETIGFEAVITDLLARVTAEEARKQAANKSAEPAVSIPGQNAMAAIAIGGGLARKPSVGLSPRDIDASRKYVASYRDSLLNNDPNKPADAVSLDRAMSELELQQKASAPTGPMSEFEKRERDRNYVSMVEFYLESTDSRASRVQVISNGLRPIIKRYEDMWRLAKNLVGRLGVPAGVAPEDFDAQRQMMLDEYNGMKEAELYDEIMGALGSANNITAAHQSMYTFLTTTGRITHHRQFTPVPSVEGAASAALLCETTNVQIAFNLQNGYTQVHESQIAALQATDIDARAPLHKTVVSAPALGKTSAAEAGAALSLPCSTVMQGHETGLANHTRVGLGGFLAIRDEGGPIVTDQTGLGQSKNPGERARIKQDQVSGTRAASRPVRLPDGKMGKEDFVKDFVVVQSTSVNLVKQDPETDRAWASRTDMIVLGPDVDMHVKMNDRSTDPYSAERRAFGVDIRKLSHQKAATNVLLVLQVRAGLIPSMSIELLRVMQNCSMIEVLPYLPGLLTDNRAAARHADYAALWVFTTAFYTIFHSEGSPLLTYTADLKDVHSAQEIYVSQLARLVGPYLCANGDHGCFMITRTVEVGWSRIYYRVMRTLAGCMGRFTRSSMARVFEQNGVTTVDAQVTERMKERCAVEYPLFIKFLLDYERDIDMYVAGKHGPACVPAFSAVELPGASQQPQEIIAIGGPFARVGNGRVRAGFVPNQRDSRMCDPNWITLGASKDHVIAEGLSFVASKVQVDNRVLSTILDDLGHKRVRHPVLARVMRTSSNCTFEDLTFEIDESDPTRTRPRYAENPVVRQSGNQFQILVHALMLPPQMLLYLMLSAWENPHTRTRTIVIPLEMERFPGLFYDWEIRNRPKPLVVVNKSASAGIARRRIEIQTGKASALGNISEQLRVFDRDPETECFEKHMRDLYQMPNYFDLLEVLKSDPDPVARSIVEKNHLDVKVGDKPTARQYNFMRDYWIATHPAAPGAVEKRIRWLHDNAPMFADAKKMRDSPYPATEVVESELQYRLLELEKENKLFCLRPGDASEARRMLLDKHEECKRFMRCLQWRLFDRDYYPVSRAIYDSNKHRRGLLVETVADMYPGQGVVMLNRVAVPPPMRKVTHQLAALKAKDGLLESVNGPHYEALESYYAFRKHLRNVALAMAHTATGDEFDALSVIRAQNFVMSKRGDEELPGVLQRVRWAASESHSIRPPSALTGDGINYDDDAMLVDRQDEYTRQSDPNFVQDSFALYARYKKARDWTRSARAEINRKIFSKLETQLRIMRHGYDHGAIFSGQEEFKREIFALQ